MGFVFAAGKCATDIVKMLVARGVGVRVERNGTNAMVLAATAECEDTLRYLVAVGADVNAKNSEGVTPLMAAASTGNVTVVQLLLDGGADLDVTTPDGDSAWIRAAVGNFPDVADLFRKVRESKR
jgi:ankyrin repeat protein